MLAEFVERQFIQAEQKAFAKGEQKGRQEGLDEGAVRALTNEIVAILSDRFGELPDSIYTYLNQLDKEGLSRHLRKAIKIKTLDEFMDVST